MVHKGKKIFFKKQVADTSSFRQAGYSKPNKKAKIIVRNLPFKNLSEESIEELFKEYGDIEEIKLLRKDDGKFIGCGFIQFKKVSSAAKAIHHANLKEIHGRKIVVDWALPKNTFIEKAQKIEKELADEEVKTEPYSDEEVKTEPYSDEESFNIEYSIDNKPDSWSVKQKNIEEEQEENEELDSEDESEEEEEVENKEKNFRFNNERDENYLNKKSHKIHPSDVEEGKTVFIRNIPFSATNEDLKKCVEVYGSVEYALICVDKLTEHSKGTAFVKFKDKQSASQCIKDSMKIFLLENPLTVTVALSKENLDNKKTSNKVIKDSRNLYLVREGVIMAGSKAAMGVSASDMAKRLQIEQWKTQILKNLNMFVSKTRLVIHNLPPTFDDHQLKRLFLKYGNPTAIIKEAKVMYDRKKADAQGNGLSKEVGFVSFTNHEDALTALRNINNNPTIFTSKKRPIVSFSIENREVLNQKLKRIEKSRAKLGISCDKSDKLSKLNRKQRRFIKRKQKIIEKRREARKLKQEINTGCDKESVTKEVTCKKRKCSDDQECKKKQKIDPSDCVNSDEPKQFSGVISNPGKKIKLRSRFKLKTQASIHKKTLKKEKQKKREKERKKLGSTKLPKQKKQKPKLMDDAKLSKLLSKHRESIQESSLLKKWYEK